MRHTLCFTVDLSVVEVVFNKAVALSLAYIIAVIFLGLAVAMHYIKEKYSSEVNDEALADLKIQFDVITIWYYLMISDVKM